MTTSHFLTPHWYNRTPRGYLRSIWPHIFLRSQRGVEVFITGRFMAIVLRTYWWHEQIHQKMPPPKNKKMEGSWMCVQHQFLRVCARGHFLVLLHFSKLRLDGRCYKNQNTFYSSLVPEGKEKLYFQNVHIWLFKNWIVIAGLF